ncbi:serine protease ea-like [Lycorma delicatula]|uniref:serine protease ea-like n=1 Tax=Lycorma delicatula TaxID=130591 RepID=UPI003F51905C
MSEDIIEDQSYPFMYPGADEKELSTFDFRLRELTCGYTDGEPIVCCPNQNVLPSRPQAKPTTTTTKPSFISNSNEQNCGLPHLYNWQANNYKGIGSQPWVVRVGFKNKLTGLLEHPCCGSIIGPRVVLTAAHCALRKPETLRIVSVRVGEFDLSNNPDCTQIFCALPVQDVPLGHVVVHPGYSSKNYRHNVALLVLKNRLNYSVTVQPICLHQSHSPLEGSRAKLVGWGKLPGDTETRKRQQQLELPVISFDHCVRIYGSVGGEEGKDACSGFGGAPLLLLQQYSHPVYTQIGIVSFGSEKCGLQGVPSVYVRVDQYTEWIKLNSPQE